MRLRAAKAIGLVTAVGASMLAVPSPALGATSAPHYLRTFQGDQTGELYGWAVSALADVDGDGVQEAIIGVPSHARSDGSLVGHTDVRSGRTGKLLHRLWGHTGDRHGYAIADAGDVNGDGVHSGRTGARLRTFYGDETTRDLGWFFVAAVPSVDGDNRDDVHVGDFDAGNGNTFTGRAFVYSSATGKAVHVFDGENTGDGLGPGRGAGDVDGDGVGDLAIGSYTNGTGGPQAGKVQVFSGATGEELLSVISDRDGENFGFDVVGLGDVNGDGRLDLLASAAGADRVYIIST